MASIENIKTYCHLIATGQDEIAEWMAKFYGIKSQDDSKKTDASSSITVDDVKKARDILIENGTCTLPSGSSTCNEMGIAINSGTDTFDNGITFGDAIDEDWVQEYQEYVENKRGPAQCECGVDSVGGGFHSQWCPKHDS